LLNAIWIGFFLIAFVFATVNLVFFGQADSFALVMKAAFDAARNGFEIALGLTGVMALWLGVMRVGERSRISARADLAADSVVSAPVPRRTAQPPCLGRHHHEHGG